MGKCKYCGRDAGFLRSVHRECKAVYELGTVRIVELVQQGASNPSVNIQELDSQVVLIATNSFVQDEEVIRLVKKGWELAVKQSIEKRDFTAKTERELSRLADFRFLTQHFLARSVIWSKYLDGRRRAEERKDRLSSKRKLAESLSKRKIAQEATSIRIDLVQVATARKRRLAQVAAARESRLAKESAEREREQQQKEAKHRRTQALQEAERQRILKQEETEQRLKLVREEAELNRRRMQEKIIKSIKDGRQITSNLSVDETPFNLQRSETLVWVFTNAEYLQEQIVRRRQLSGFYSSPTKYGMELVDRGTMGVTTKHLYFIGNSERFRIEYDNIVAFKEYPDGVGVARGAEQSRHQKFVTGEGWFVYNLVTALARLYYRSD